MTLRIAACPIGTTTPVLYKGLNLTISLKRRLPASWRRPLTVNVERPFRREVIGRFGSYTDTSLTGQKQWDIDPC